MSATGDSQQAIAIVEAAFNLNERLDTLIQTLRSMRLWPDTLEITGRVGTLPSPQPYTGQTFTNTTAVRLISGSPGPPTNGVLVQALKANANTVYIGQAGVTTKNGFELQAGQAIAFTCDVYSIFVVGSATSDGVCWSVV